MASITPPTISLVTILTTYLEGSGTETLASDVTLAAGNSGDIASATITINSGYQSLEDVLAFPDANGITGSWDGGSGILTLSPSTPLPSISTWEQALESVTYQNNTDNPNTSDRAFVIEIEDEGGSQASDDATFSVTAVNDAPTISSATGSTVTENTETAETEVGNISASDVDDTFLTYSITSGDPNIFFSIDSFGVITLTTAGESALYQDNLATTTYTLEITVSDDELASTTANVDIIFQAVNDPPALADAGDVLSFIEDSAAAVIDGSLTLNDVDDTDLASATVQITSGFIATEDVLGFTDANGITHTWNSGTGVLTLSGTSSVTNYKAALESVTYQNTNTTNPGNGTRVVTWTVSDGSLSSSAATSTITIIDQNDPSSFSGDLVVETQGLNAFSGTISATDPDTASSGTFSVTGSPGQGTISSFGSGTGTYTYEQTGTNLQLAGSDSFTVSYNDGVFGSTSQTIVINYNAEPVINSTTGSTVSYGSGNTTSVVASINATDTDDLALTYSITGGDFDSYFTIDSSTGDIRLNAAGASAVNSASFTTISYALVVRVQDDAAPNPAFDTSSVDVTLEGQQVYVRFRASTSAGVGATAVGTEPSPGLGTEFWGCLQYEPSVTQNPLDMPDDIGTGDGYFFTFNELFTTNNYALRMKAYSNTGRYVETDTIPNTALERERGFIKYDTGELRFFVSQTADETPPFEYQSFYVLDPEHTGTGTGVPTSWSSVSADAYLGIGFGPENVPNQTGTGQSWVYPKITEWVVESTPCYIGVDGNNDSVLDEDDLLSSNADLLFNNFFGGDTAGVTDEDTTATGILVGIDEDGLDATQPFSITGTGPANGTATISNTGSTATWQYTPNANYFGTDSFTVRFTDALGNSQSQLITITVNSVNDVPSTATDFFTIKEDSELTGAVSSNDVESGDGGNTYTNTSGPANGSLLTFDNGDGTFTYAPNADFYGTDSFTYELEDSDGDVSTSTVTITVDDVPDAVDDAFSTNEDTPLTADVSQNDVPSVDGTNTYGVVTGVGQGPNHGSLSWNNNGSFVYTPDANFSGSDTFDYVLSDADGDQSTGTVSITINSVDDAPVAESKSLTVDEDSPGTNLGLLTPTTPDTGETLTVTVTEIPDAGQGIISNAGTALAANDTITPSGLAGLTFTPTSNYDSTVNAFIYSLSDGTGNDDSTGTVTITINPQNDSPVAVDDVFNTSDDTVLSDNVSNNDTPGDGQNIYSVVSTEAPNHGVLALNSNGTFTYAPGLNFIGTDTFGYQVSDADGETANATVTINVLSSQLDDDNDGLGNADELTNGTDPNNPDTDGDGVSDGDEIANSTDPTNADTDGDGVNDFNDQFPLAADWQARIPFSSATEVPGELMSITKGAIDNPSMSTSYGLGGNTYRFNQDATGLKLTDDGSTSFNWTVDTEGRIQIVYQNDASDETVGYRYPNQLTNIASQAAIDAFIATYGNIQIEIRTTTATEVLSLLGTPSAEECTDCNFFWAQTSGAVSIVNTTYRAALLGSETAGPVELPIGVGSQRTLVDLPAQPILPILDGGLPFGGSQALTADIDPSQAVGRQLPADTMLFNQDGTGLLLDRTNTFNWTTDTEGRLVVTPTSGSGLGATLTYQKYEAYGTGQSLVYVTVDTSSEQYALLSYAVPDQYNGSATESDLTPLLDKLLLNSFGYTTPAEHDDVENGILTLANMFGYRLNSDGTATRLFNAEPSSLGTDTWHWRVANGTIYIEARRLLDSGGNPLETYSSCDPNADSLCQVFRSRNWRVLDIDSNGRMYVIESEPPIWFVDIQSRVNFYQEPLQDRDGDLVSDTDEVFQGLDPYVFNDADGDGLSDFDETNNTGTNPTVPDTDGDGVADGFDTDPLDSSVSGVDSNLDGIDDAWAATYYTGALNPDEDLDGDSLTVRDEYVSGTLDTFFNERQIITAPEPRLRLNRASRIPLQYSVSDNNQALPGLGLRIHFHGDAFSLFKLEASTPYLNGLVEIDNVWKPDTNNLDANFFTDHYIEVKWNDANGNWPGEGLPVALGQLLVAPNPATSSGEAIVDFSPSALAPNYGLDANELALRFGRGNSFDIDEDGKVTPLSDGLMMVRFLFGFTTGYEPLISANSPHVNDPSAIIDRLNEHLPMMDIDDDGDTAALSDGLLLIRYLFGFRGDALISNAVGQGATRTDAATIEAHLNEMMTQ